MPGETVTIIVTVRTDMVGSECTDTLQVDKEEWENMSPEDREEYCRDFIFNHVEWSWWEVK